MKNKSNNVWAFNIQKSKKKDYSATKFEENDGDDLSLIPGLFSA